jgi:NADPH:quinone reductase-like Zn-dependent oxidoreductase
MRAIAICSFGGVEQLQPVQLPLPRPGPDEVLIQVKAAGVGYWDIAVRENMEGLGQGRSFPLVLGWESAGIVTQRGAGVTGFAVGDAVFAYPFQRGNYAEYVAAPVSQVAHKPQTLDFVHAAALPVNGVTALQAITEALNMQRGEKLLITGAAGGTGMLAIQLAAQRGAYIIVTASARNHAFLRQLGAHEVWDYVQDDYAAVIRTAHPAGLDAVLECVESPTGDNFYRSLTTLRPGGRMVSIVTWPNHRPLRPDVRVSYLIGQPETRLLQAIATLVDSGQLRVEVQQVLALEQAAAAHQLVATRHTRGRVVLQVAD